MTTPNNFLSFVDFYVPDVNFGVTDIFQWPVVKPTPIYYPKVVTAPQTVYTPPVLADLGIIKKTITFTVADNVETIPGANIAVNGIGTAVTDGNGRVTLPNIDIDSIITVSYIGYDTYTMIASAIPVKVILKSGAVALPEVIVTAWKPAPAPVQTAAIAPSNNTWAWLLAGAVGVAVVMKYAKGSGAKVVRAKL